jgi:hypothetical protein
MERRNLAAKLFEPSLATANEWQTFARALKEEHKGSRC